MMALEQRTARFAQRRPVWVGQTWRWEKRTYLVLFGLGVLILLVLATHMSSMSYEASLTMMSIQQQEQIIASPSAHPTPRAAKNVPVIASSKNASGHLVRLNQLDCDQYASQSECATWAQSACSAASMTEVLNAYGGHHYRITDILQVESALGEITPQLGLVENSGVAHTLAHFGFATEWGVNRWSLDQLVAIANTGFPVIVGFPPPLWGHILVVRGGDAHNVILADSSRYAITLYPRSRFLYYWRGFAAIALPYSPASYQQLAVPDAQQAHIRPDIFTRQINMESGFQPFVVSPAGALGIAQFMPRTAAGVGLNPWDPVASLQAAARYMAGKLASYGGDYARALASYNAGSGTVDTAVRLYGSNWLAHMPKETQAYVRDILG